MSGQPSRSELGRAITAVVQDSLGVKPGETVVVVCDPGTRNLGELMRDEAAAIGAEAVLALMDARENDGTEPPAPIAAAMARADVVLAPTTRSISHTVARRSANEAGARIATLPGADEDVLARMMSADMAELARRGAAIAQALTAASEARITTADGSDLRLGLEGREGISDDGRLTTPGIFGNLPCGEGFIAPVEGTADGRLVFAGTIATYGMPPGPVELTIEGGHLRSAVGAAGEWLMRTLTGAGTDGTNVAELGVDTNERARLSDNLIEAEKILGTVHVAFGASAGIGGIVQVPIHIDCVVTEPTLELDGEPLLRAGELLV
jgi:leucyl aminopeptidase (aminopeptidase T)